MKPVLRVCYFGTHDPAYPRNQIVVDGLRTNGAEVIECNIPLWSGSAEKLQKASGGWFNPAFLFRVLSVYLRLVWKGLTAPAYDVMLVGYPGPVDMIPARLLSWLRGAPLAFDLLMSLYLLMEERKLTTANPITNRLAFWVEKTACRAADLIIMDTPDYVQYLCDTYKLPPDKFRLAPLGADERVYYPVPSREKPDANTFKVNYYGTFIPVHGVETIVEAMHLLRDQPDIRMQMIGKGPLKDKAAEIVRQHGLKTVDFVDWVEKHELLHYVADADLCLGVFGTTRQSRITVPNKIWEGLAMARPVITGDGPAVRRVLEHGQHLYLCQPADPQALAQAILALRDDPALRRRLADNGRRLYLEQYTMQRTGARFEEYLLELLGEKV